MKLEHTLMIFDAGKKKETKIGYVLDITDNGDWTVAYIDLYQKKNINKKYSDVHALMTLFDKDNMTDEFKMNAVNNQLFVDTNKIANLPLNKRGQSPVIVTKSATS